MGFEIGKNVQSGDVTYSELKAKLGDKFDESKLKSVFNQFNTNATANDNGEQVLDQSEQIAMMSFFKEIAGGKKGKADDTKLGRGDLRHYKKAHKGDANMSFVQNLGYKDMKKIMQAFTGVVEADSTDNMEIEGYEQKDGEVTSVTIKDKKYTIDKDNRLTDADGVKYEYKDGKLSKVTDVNKSTTFNNGVRHQEVKTGEDGSTTETTYQADGRTLQQTVVNDKTNNKTTKTNYNDKGVKTDDEVVDNNANTTTTTNYRSDGNTKSSVIVENRTNKTKTTTNFQTDGKTKARETVEDNSNPQSPKKTVTNYNVQGGLTNRTITEGNKTTKIDYSTKTRTTTGGDIETVENFSNFNTNTGEVGTVTKKVETNKKDHTRTTTEPSKPHVKTVELLDENNKTVQRTVKIDTSAKTATFTSGGKTITLQTDSQGNIISNRKCKGLRMENLEEAVTRLGFTKGSAEYNAILAANKNNNGAIKIPKDIANLRGLNLNNAVVDAQAEKRKLNANIVNHRETNRKTYGEKAFNAYNNSHSDAKLRTTWASDSMQVYCTENTNENGYNQHMIYDAKSNSLVKLELYLKLGEGQYVDRITEDGHARVQPGGKLVKINISSGKATVSDASVNDYNASFTESVKKGAKGEIQGTVDKEKHKYVYQGNQRTNVLDDKVEVLANDGTWVSQEDVNDYNVNTEIANKAQSQGYTSTKSPLVFTKGAQYYYYKAETDEFLPLNGIQQVNDNGTIKLTDGKDYQVSDIILGDIIYDDADDHSGGDSMKAMYKHIPSLTADNVVEVYNAYKTRAAKLGINETMISTMTNEWLGYGTGHGRDYALRNTKHIISKLVEKAKKSGVADTEECMKKAQEFINDTIWADTYITSHGLNDDALDDKAEPLIDALLTAIENAPAQEADESSTEEVVEEEVVS